MATEGTVLPIAIDPTVLHIGLAGAGEGLARRRATLAQGGVVPVPVPLDGSLAGLHLLFVAGLERSPAAALAARARAASILVNVEDVPELCDFHMPAVVRRGDLALTVSTSGKAPGLARLLREWLERAVGTEWQDRLERLAVMRAGWRSDGLGPSEVSRRIRELVVREGWLP
jgi:precorrin-2 dehydrogenase/sirohydrochlorin ferrochelatase